MKLIKRLRSQAGIGLVEVMMGVAISGGLALTVAKLMENSSQNMKQNEAKSENINLKGLIQNILSNTTACNYTFSPLITQANLTTLSANTANQVTVPSVKDKVNAIAYSTASTNVNPLTITSLSLTNYNAATGTGDLLIQSTFRRSSTQVQMVKPIRIPLNFNINNTNPSSPVLVGCSTMSVGGEWLLGGNAGTNETTDYLGTSDSQPLIFRVNAINSGRLDTTGNVFLGYRSVPANTSGSRNVAIGFQNLENNTSGSLNIVIGSQNMRSNTTGAGNVVLGSRAYHDSQAGNNNIAIGEAALYASKNGDNNIAIGQGAMSNANLGSEGGGQNIAIGFQTLNRQTNGQSVAIGHQAMTNGQDIEESVAIGYRAMYSAVNLTQNTAIGHGALYSNNNNGTNTAVGYQSLYSLTNNGYNTALGIASGRGLTTGSYNTFLGAMSGAGTGNITGHRNIFIGVHAGNSSTWTNTTGVNTASDKLYINNGVTNVPLIEGDFSSAGRYLKFDSKVGIGLGAASIGAVTVPEPATTTNIKLQVKGGVTVIDQEPWALLTLGSGWEPCTWPGAVAPSYFRDSVGVVHLKGCIKRSGPYPVANNSMATAFTMPAGYRASNHGSWQGPMIRTSDGGGPTGTEFCMLQHIFTSGQISIFASGGSFTSTSMVCHLTGLTWRADL